MKLVSLELPPPPKRKGGAETVGPSEGDDTGPRYPYGTEVDLPPELVEKLGLKGIDRDGDFTLTGTAYVSDYSERTKPDGEETCRIRFQITALAVEPAKDTAKEKRAGQRLNALAGYSDDDAGDEDAE